MFKIPSPPAKKKASKFTSHRLLTADEIFEQKMKKDEEKKRKLDEKESRKQLREMKLKIKKERLGSKKEKKPLNNFLL